MRGQGKLGTLAIWIIAMYLVVQCWIFFYNLDSASTTELWSFETKETANELGVSLHERLFHAPRVKNCTIPGDWLYPLCKYKVEWMRLMWSSDRKCYVDRHGIDPRDDCSLLIFFSEVEKWCPLLPWRRHLYSSVNAQHSTELAIVREDLSELFKKMNHSKYQWMRDRITRLWPDWKLAAKQLETEKSAFRNRRVKNILFYMGAFAYHEHWLERAYSGLPLGEMVQWSDLIASSYILGHNITLSSEQEFINRTLVETPDNTCARRTERKPFDLLYTDYLGTFDLQVDLGPMLSQYRCSLRILDSFGTEAEFNYAEYPSEGADFGNLDIQLRQMLTMFPHSPDNLFLGFAIDKVVAMETSQGASLNDTKKPADKPIGLLYAKDALFLFDRRNYIDTLSKYLEIHGTIGNETEEQQKDVQDHVPDYVINHGVMKAGDLQQLLRRSKIFIGLGEPYEGPAPLEAISQGCVFINPKLDPPLSRKNSGFFEGKPTYRKVGTFIFT
ncbi:alpha-1,6-mannosylglycoprotein 6-beta-N-acetylglucosaminyltransferase A-like [Orbicella faveolata]|uniref:alpha-1,6-mannosylglycoprotein 6-beta-N-acetylglucosaminyltransferase A-like n=1 Tax=Orbicella faveolata TaxID=48498 RepID=UPI0009E4D415|nr:alpha-1,6-mannosylglycoprotein 6-beta-N-acetylglucosaminyltransferase A-like [Orbicella faveolata]